MPAEPPPNTKKEPPAPVLGSISLDWSNLEACLKAANAFARLPDSQKTLIGDQHDVKGANQLIDQFINFASAHASIMGHIPDHAEDFAGVSLAPKMKDALKLGQASLKIPNLSTDPNVPWTNPYDLISILDKAKPKSHYGVGVAAFKQWLQHTPVLPKGNMLDLFCAQSSWDKNGIKAAVVALITGQNYAATKKQYDQEDKAEAKKAKELKWTISNSPAPDPDAVPDQTANPSIPATPDLAPAHAQTIPIHTHDPDVLAKAILSAPIPGNDSHPAINPAPPPLPPAPPAIHPLPWRPRP